MADKTTKANVLSYESAHIAIVKQGGKVLRVKIPTNSEHPPLGEGELKDKWSRKELSKDDLADLDSKKEEPKEKK